MFQRPLELLAEADLQDLVDRVQEGKYLEYKEALPSASHDDAREFLADLSSFANAGGGYIVYGVVDKRDAAGRPTGVPERLGGIKGVTGDASILRLENIARDGIQPRLPGVSMRFVSLLNGNSALIVQIPRSWAAPHVVDYQGHWRFYGRNSAGKYPLDIGELRAAFAQAELTSRHITEFRMDRLARVVAGETPIPLTGEAKTVLHIVPLASFDPGVNYDLRETDRYALLPIRGGSTGSRTNFDGVVSYDGGSGGHDSYVQLFRSGKVEAVDAGLLSQRDGRKFIASVVFERALIAAYERYVRVLRDLSVSPPVVVCLSLLGVRGYTMAASPSRVGFFEGAAIDRADLLVPEVTVDDLATDGSTVLRPAFDLIWNATGWPRSMNYDDTGQWAPK